MTYLLVLPPLPKHVFPPAGSDASGPIEVVLVVGKANRIDSSP